MRHDEGRHPEIGFELHWLVRFDDASHDVLVLDEQAPRPVRAEVLPHAAGAVHGHPSSRHGFLAEIHQPCVVTDVGVRQKNAVERAAVAQAVGLRRKIRCGIEEIRAVQRSIDETDRRHLFRLPSSGTHLHASRLLARQLWNAGVLRNAKDHERPAFRILMKGALAAQHGSRQNQDDRGGTEPALGSTGHRLRSHPRHALRTSQLAGPAERL